jgi:hypothetical protein
VKYDAAKVTQAWSPQKVTGLVKKVIIHSAMKLFHLVWSFLEKGSVVDHPTGLPVLILIA